MKKVSFADPFFDETTKYPVKFDGVVKNPIYCVAAHFEILDILYVLSRLKKYTTPCISIFLLSHPMIFYECIKFAVPVFFGDSPNSSYSASLKNGTATLLKLGDRFFGVTCHHVLEGFRQYREAKDGFFQLGPIHIDPEQHLIIHNSYF